jgi:methionine sulfoxide reductase heme-binding subunit
MTEASLRTLLHVTARTTFVLFVCAFAGPALGDLRPGSFSLWLARRRDWLLLAVAGSHTLHLAAIIAFFQVVGWSKLRLVTLAGGGFIYLLIYGLAMVAVLRLRGKVDAFLLGAPKFEAVAMYAIWLIFALAFVPRIVSGWPVYSVFAVAALAALVLRIVCLVRHRRALSAAA